MLIDVDLTDDQISALAQFLKRAGFSDYLRLAVDKDEAYVMIDAGEKLRAALAELGYAPR
jgi:hypothetical protein